MFIFLNSSSVKLRFLCISFDVIQSLSLLSLVSFAILTLVPYLHLHIQSRLEIALVSTCFPSCNLGGV